MNYQTSGVTAHPIFGEAKYSAYEVSPDPETGVSETINRMRDLVNEDSKRPEMQQWAASICGNPAESEADVVRRAYRHTQDAIRFQRDEKTGAGVGGYSESDVIEVIVRPIDMANYISQGKGIGDCDDYSMYLACLLAEYGIPVEFVTVAADANVPDQFSHVYVAAYPMNDETGQRERVALDASHGPFPGWEVPNRFNKIKQWPIGGTDFLTIALATLAGMLAFHFLKEEIFAA